MSTETTPKTLLEAIRFFADFSNCIVTRWPDGVTCPTCGSKDVRFIAPRKIWECKNKHSRKQFSAKIGTIFEDSPVDIDKWFVAIWLITNAKNGISSYELHRSLGVTQKTAWFMLHRIRLAMHDGDMDKLSGAVEADETLIGGKARNMHKAKKEKVLKKGRGSAGKTVVMGLLERHTSEKEQEKVIDTLDYGPKKDKKTSRVKLSVIPNTKRQTLHAEVKENVGKGSKLFTDTLASYDGLEDEYHHEAVNHAECYVRDHVVHTNGLENFWSLLKRTLRGTYVSVEPFQYRYLDEQSYRFNERKLTDDERFVNVTSAISGKHLTYKGLTGKAATDPLPLSDPGLN